MGARLGAGMDRPDAPLLCHPNDRSEAPGGGGGASQNPSEGHSQVRDGLAIGVTLEANPSGGAHLWHESPGPTQVSKA